VTGQTRLRHIRRVILLLDPEHNVDGLPADDENVAAPVAPTVAPTPVMAASARLLQHYGLTLDEDLLFFVSLAQALETRHTNWHGRTARQLFLCMEMNRFSGQKVDPEQLAVAVLLHDLGMSFLPSSVLDEHGQPDPAQRSLWERHSEHCAGMLASSPRWQDAAAMIWQHHEAVDGSGLPDQLAGDEIADGAKILAIADMFDARTNELGAQADGKRAMVKAVVEINHQIGKAFDELWVGIFNQVIKQHQQRFQ
jgi:HD-GYP domain-containing protein (c-di-GMP phosphodiesterase class II)